MNEHTAEVEKLSAWLAYMDSERGHELAKHVLRLLESFTERHSVGAVTQYKWEKIQQATILIIVVAALLSLAMMGKMDASAGVLLGTLAGYAFAKRT